MFVVIDANVFVSAAIQRGASFRIVESWLTGTGGFEIVMCPALLGENRRGIAVVGEVVVESAADDDVHRETPSRREGERLTAMSEQDIDRYLAGLDEPKRSTLEALRQTILAVVPDAEQCISYGLPAFKVNGKVVAGFAAFNRHLSYLPHSGSVLSALGDDLAGYEMTKGSLHFPIDEPLPERLVKKLVTARLEQLGIT